MFQPVTKWNGRVERIDAIPEMVRKAFRVAQLEKPGPTHIELPENRAAMPPESGDRTAAAGAAAAFFPEPTDEAIATPRRWSRASSRPLILAGNGVLRRRASARCVRSPRRCTSRSRSTFMGKGADRRSRPPVADGRRAAGARPRADRLRPGRPGHLRRLRPGRVRAGRAGTRTRQAILSIDTQPAEVDAATSPLVELVGDIGGASSGCWRPSRRGRARPRTSRGPPRAARGAARRPARQRDDDGWPIKPQKAIHDLRRALGPEDIVISDVGAHKVWVARLYQAYEPNTVIISNGFAAMGISLPGAIAAKLVHPQRKVVALTGDGAFLMNSQELETAVRIGTNIVVVVWRDDGYGLIDWKQRNEFGRPFAVEFGNPDLVAYAESFGIAGFRAESSADLYPTLMQVDAAGARQCDVDGPHRSTTARTCA
jgi:acetolactate synthase I/II/III large subunit